MPQTWSDLVDYNPSYSHLKLKSPGKFRLSNIRGLSNNRRLGGIMWEKKESHSCVIGVTLAIRWPEKPTLGTRLLLGTLGLPSQITYFVARRFPLPNRRSNGGVILITSTIWYHRRQKVLVAPARAPRELLVTRPVADPHDVLVRAPALGRAGPRVEHELERVATRALLEDPVTLAVRGPVEQLPALLGARVPCKVDPRWRYYAGRGQVGARCEEEDRCRRDERGELGQVRFTKRGVIAEES